MQDQQLLAVRRWSTADVDAVDSLDYYASAVGDALVPMSVGCGSRSNFHASMEMASLGPLELFRLFGSAHRVSRGETELARSERRLFHLVVNRLAPWRVVQQGRIQLRPGDAILMDSNLPHELAVGTYELINITMSASFVEQWVPDPRLFTSRRLAHDGRWSSTLAAFASQLTPQFATSHCPLPTEVMTQQLGVLLMLAAGALGSQSSTATASEAVLNVPIVKQMRERLGEADLTASRIAESLNLPERTVHLALAAHGRTFAALLTRLRLDRVKLLGQSCKGWRLGADDLAQRAGFRDGRRMASAFRNHSGFSDSEYQARNLSGFAMENGRSDGVSPG
ncbi:helix-turn-helix domain-containing protein [Paucibacter sp. R3-3]|uniref:Helix-turn-helix domain-containing protein n=1 Tax=Roseateles agri TaxID=3098619 RepID=A0ABU5DRT4_9BURK|nr:helix-turn-helix domain-containing protein [Paucibacter sp. R3-3]MDY0749030.1 helix-turn-helix domain-containing protein [Paucibacter sp. R3-3]